MQDTLQQNLVFGVDNEINSSIKPEWHHENFDVVLSILLIFTGVFQFVLRKWILPVSEDVMTKLENQLPSQSLLYRPGFGVFFIVLGVTMLVIGQIFT